MSSAISQLLRQRGYRITSEGKDGDIFLPVSSDLEILRIFKSMLYYLMRKDDVRRALRDWAYGKKAGEVPNIEIIDSYMRLCRHFGDPNMDGETIKTRYGSTFEWYVSELFLREFGARGSGFSIRLQDADPGDEFDCIAVIDDGVVFAECKTGKGAILSEIAKFVGRDTELGADYSLFIFDRDYTFHKEGEDTPRLTQKQAEELGIESINKVTVGAQTFYRIDAVQTTYPIHPFLFACTAFGGLEERIRYVIRYTRELQNRRRRTSPLFKVERVPFLSPTDPPPDMPAS